MASDSSNPLDVASYIENICNIVSTALGAESLNALRVSLNGLDSRSACEPGDICNKVWKVLCQSVLHPDVDFSTHQKVFTAAYQPWPTERLGPPPVWYPTDEVVQNHNITKFLQHFKGGQEFEAARDVHNAAATWPHLHALSVRDPELWRPVLLQELQLPLHRTPHRMLEPAAHPDACVWLPGAKMNVAWCALQTPRAGPGADSRPAVIWSDEAHPEVVHAVSRMELRALSLHVAACLRTKLKPGDAVAIVMPLTVVAAAIYLGCVLAGCAVVSVAESFSAQEIDSRLRIANTKLVFTQDVMLRGGKALPLLQRVISGSHTPPVIIVNGKCDLAALLKPPWTGMQSQQKSAATAALTKPRACDLTWEEFVSLVPPQQALQDAQLGPNTTPGCLHVANPQEATNILFSSGTTGEPKAIVWDHVSPLKCGTDGWAHQNIQPGQFVSWSTSLGWMMGPWLLYAALLNGACVALYNGAPLGRDYGLFLKAAKVNVLGLVPSIVKAWRHTNCMKGISWPHLKCISSTGEASSPDDYHWLYALTRYKVPVIEYCGGTELAGAYITATSLQPACLSTFTTPALGTQLVLLVTRTPASSNSNSNGNGSGTDTQLSAHGLSAQPCVGEVALAAPILGCSQRLLNKDHSKVYYDGMPVWAATGLPLRRHGDELCRLPGNYYTALGRVDDTMNLGGIKVASVELERAVLEGVPSVAEVAAVGTPSPGGGPERLVLFVVLRGDKGDASTAGSVSATPAVQSTVPPAQLASTCSVAIRNRLNPLFKVDQVVVVAALPRNASNKIMRRTLRDTLVQQMQQRARM